MNGVSVSRKNSVGPDTLVVDNWVWLLYLLRVITLETACEAESVYSTWWFTQRIAKLKELG